MRMSVLFFFLAAKLAAGGVYVSSQTAAHGGADAVLFKHGGKSAYSLLVRGREFGLINGVDRDEIYVNGEAVTM